jgi:inner membrane protein
MRNATHELIGVSLALAGAKALEADSLECVGLAAASLCGSRLPDVDQLGARVHRRSRAERRSPLLGAVGASLRLPSLAFAALVPHRGITHSALACAAATGVAALIAFPTGGGTAFVVGAGVAIGYAAHLAADACTPGGASLWAPVSPQRVWLLPPRARIRTGSLREAALAAGALAALALVLFG